MARKEEKSMGTVTDEAINVNSLTRRRCHRCFTIGHLTSQCPKGVREGGSSRTGPVTGTITDWGGNFGFIQPADGGEKIPFSNLQVVSPLLRVGDMVEYCTFVEHFDFGAMEVTAVPREGTCNICRFTGHEDADCPGIGKRCHFCGEYGHSDDICPNNSGESICYGCNKLGHMTHECPGWRKPDRRGDCNDGGVCVSCGKTDHSSRWCRNIF